MSYKYNNLTIIIPAKNEELCLPTVIKNLNKYKFRIFIILEKTDYKTIKSINDLDCKIIFQTGKGYGDALIKGIASTNTKYLCIFNADGSFKTNEILNMYNKINTENLDIIFGSRYEKNSKSDDDTIITFFGNRFFSFLGKILFNLPINDILYTFVLGKTDKIKKLNLEQTDFKFCVELPIKSKIQKLNIGQISCHERIRMAGLKKVNAMKDGYLILKFLLILFFRDE